MSLAEDIETLRSARPTTFKQWLKVAPENRREEVLGYVYDEELPENALAELLSTKHNVPITRETIVRLRDARR